MLGEFCTYLISVVSMFGYKNKLGERAESADKANVKKTFSYLLEQFESIA